ncbi:MAG: hypothetical protein J6U63_03100 [Clostridia bacterium]|nr:hypothetical protein [Clostridia bacterium]
MKKLLTILALVLALCMLMGVALAADDDEEQGDSAFGGISYEEAMRIHEIEGHEVEGEPEVIRESTCSVRGIVRYKCVTDPTHFHELYLAKADHKWGRWVESGDPCTTGITRTHTCTICGAVETEVLQAGNHLWASDYANWSDEDKEKYSPFDPNIEMSSSNPNDMSWGVVGEEPTCTEPGWAVDFCARCLKIRWDDPDSIRAIDPLGHKFGDEIAVETKPNCLEPGTRTFIHICERCGLTENVPDKEPEEIPVPVPVPDELHDWDKPIVVEAPTCWKDGKALRWCVRCGD